MLIVVLAAALSCAHPETQSDMTACAVSAAAAAEADLTRIYHQLPRSPELVKAERAWIAYRDAECLYEHHADPSGSMYGMEQAMCEEEMARARAAVLKASIVERGWEK